MNEINSTSTPPADDHSPPHFSARSAALLVAVFGFATTHVPAAPLQTREQKPEIKSDAKS